MTIADKIYIIGFLFTIPAVYTDFKYHKIYNKLTFSGIILAFLLNIYFNGYSGLIFSLKGFFLGIALFIIPFSLYVVGAGDVKLAAMIGVFSGWKDLLNIFIYFLAVSGVIAAIQITLNKRWKIFFRSLYTKTLFFKDLRNSKKEDKFKTGLAISFFIAQVIIYFLKF